MYRNAQIGFTSRGLIDVYAAIAPMVERNPIRRAIRESKRSLDASFVEPPLRFPPSPLLLLLFLPPLSLSASSPCALLSTTLAIFFAFAPFPHLLSFVSHRPRNYRDTFIVGTLGPDRPARTILIR